MLGVCEFAINSAPSASTGKTPNVLTYGQEVRLPADVALGRSANLPIGQLGQRILQLMAEARTCVERA